MQHQTCDHLSIVRKNWVTIKMGTDVQQSVPLTAEGASHYVMAKDGCGRRPIAPVVVRSAGSARLALRARSLTW